MVWSGTANKCLSGETETSYTKAQCKGLSDDAQAVFTFNNVNIEESGKIQFKVDIYDNDRAANKTIQFTPSSINGDVLSGAKYDNVSKQYVKGGDVAGSVSFSKVTIQPAKASLENNLSKDVEFIANETNRKVVFDGTYTAKKADIDLNKFTISTGSAHTATNHKATFYLFIDGEEVGDTNTFGSEESFSDVRIKAGESVKVKVEAEVEAYDTTIPYTFPTLTLELKGTDTNGNDDTGRGSDDLATMKVKASGSTTIDAASSKNTVLLKAKNQTIAEFIVKPSNKDDEDLMLDDVVVVVKTTDGTVALTGGQIKVKVDGSELDEVSQSDA